METAVNYGTRFLIDVKEQMNILVDRHGPIIIINSVNYKKGYENARKRGVKIRFLTEVTNENIQHCKELNLIVDELRHVEGLKGSICISDSEYLGMTAWRDSDLLNPVIYSNESQVIEQQRYIFESFWKNSIPFKQRLGELEEGIVHEVIELISSPSNLQNKIYDLLNSAKNEILILMSTSRAVHRQLEAGTLEILKHIAERNSELKIKILTPYDDSIKKKLTLIYSNNNIEIKFIEPLSKISIFVIDRKYALVAETKYDTALKVLEAVGFVTYSNSVPTVLSYVAIHETIWKQTEIYQQLKTAHEQLQIHDTMKKEFIYNVAHELRTPLTPIIGLTEYLRNELKNPEHQQILDRVIKDAKKLSILNEKVLDVTRFESHSFKIDKKRLNLNYLIIDTIQELQQSLDYINQVEFEYNFEGEYFVYVDKFRIQQVIFNLVDNSIKSVLEQIGNTKEIITITIKKKYDDLNLSNNDTPFTINHNHGEEVVVIIKDTGVGINKDILPRLFTKFVSKSFQGVGLGLYLSKCIIKIHGGEIWAENNNGGPGATFGFSLPL